MAEYINKYELLNAIDKRNGRLPLWLDEILMQDCKPCDVAPVVHGHWIKTNLMFASSQTGRHGNVHVCSNCGEQSGFGFKTPYCAICGAKMDGVNDEQF